MLAKLPQPLVDAPSPPVATIYGDRFTQGREYRTLREAGRSDWLMILTLEDLGYVASALDIRHARSGDLTCFPPGAPQDYATHPEGNGWTFLWMHFSPRPHWLPWLDEMTRPKRMFHASLPEGLRDSISNAWQEAIIHVRRPHPMALLWAQWAFERVLLLLRDHHHASSAEGLLPKPLAYALEWGGRQIGAPFRLADWAAAGGVSSSRLSHLAKEHLGESLQRYAERMKLQHAAHLLRLTQLRVQEVAEAVGYGDPFYFSTRFRRFHGKSPRAYRQ